MKSVKLTLPEGVVVNPSAAQGLNSCSNAEFYGPHHPSQEPASPANARVKRRSGKWKSKLRIWKNPLKGEVFLGAPECDPCTPQDAEGGKMVRLFVQLVGEGEAGVIVKLEGRGMVDQADGADHDGVRRNAAGAVQQAAIRARRRPQGGAREPAGVRAGEGDWGLHAVEHRTRGERLHAVL